MSYAFRGEKQCKNDVKLFKTEEKHVKDLRMATSP